jgi:hypothetical protein
MMYIYVYDIFDDFLFKDETISLVVKQWWY